MKIGVITEFNPADRKSSSGTIFSVCESLKRQGIEITWIQVKKKTIHKIIGKIIKSYYQLIGQNFLFFQTIIGAKLLSNSIKKSDLSGVDLLLAPWGSNALYNLKTNKPLVYLSDATFAGMVGYYDSFSNINTKYTNEGNLIEKRALEMADVVVLCSDWAKKTTMDYYGLVENKIKVIELGANIDDKDIKPKKSSNKNEINLLFLGVDWKRKGGDIAVEACKYINSQGIKSNLYIIGINDLDSKIASLDFVKNIGFLDKNNPKEYKKLIEIIQNCHCLILPTIAECAGIAFAESSAYGLPVFSHITGGVPNYVHDGINGYLLNLGSTGNDFGTKILECYSNGEMLKMSILSQELYKSKLNWNVWGDKMKNIFDSLI